MSDEKRGTCPGCGANYRRCECEEIERMRARVEKLEGIVAGQAEDDGLWPVAHTALEAYLQQELRRLHAAIEGKTPEECARAALAEGEE